jgi:hypothetical protein
MSLRGARLLVHVRNSVFPLVVVIAMTVGISATAQAQSSHDFASSTLGVTTDDLTPAAPSPAPAVGAGGQSGHYGYSSGHNWMSHLAFEGGGGANGPTSDSSNDITWGGNFTAGGGFRFNKYLSMLI